METKTNVAPPIEFIIPKEISWHFGVLKPESRGKYALIEPAISDIAKVVKAYSHHPMAGYNIAEIKLVYNGNLNRMFEGHMAKLNSRKGNKKYEPLWRMKTTGDEKQQREEMYQKLLTLAQPWGDHKYPHVKLLPMWHGTNDDIAQNYIFDAGYGIFTSNDPSIKTDPGFFGVGVYGAHEAEYAFRVYAKKHGDKAVLLLNWISMFEVYPVIGQDGLKLQGTMAGQDQCDAHFIPVYSDAHPTEAYFPCYPDQDAQYHEVVVFDEDQCLPRYSVKLVENIPKQGIDRRVVSDDYQRALDNLACYRYGKVASAFEEAHHAGDSAAIIRLHWLHSGASGVIPADEKALQNYQNIPKASFDMLAVGASFKGENDSECQFILGWCYEHGLGTDKNPATAAKYYWMAVNQGHRDAQYHLGVCCASGIGVKQDVSQAIVYYQQAAAQGHIHAHYVLSQCYESGLGTPANSTKALEHKQAAQQGKHPQLVGAGLPQTTSVSISPNVQLEQEVKHLKQQLVQQESKLKQQQERTVQDQQKIEELTQVVLAEQRSKDELIAKQKEEQRKKDEIIAKQNQEKAAQEIQLRDKDQWLQQQTQKITDLVKELQLAQQKLGQKDEMLNNKWFELEQLKKDLAEAKEREKQLKMEFEASKIQSQPLIPKPQSQVNPFAANPFGGNYSPTLFQPEPQKVLGIPEQVEQMSTVAKEQNKIRQEDVQTLLKWATEGHLVEVEKLLKKNPNLGVCTGTVTDRSDRTFKNITVLQYAAWSLDREMCDLIMGYIGTHNSAIQLKALYAEPGRYSTYGDHYDIKPLIAKTKTYIENYSKWNADQYKQFWQKEVGGEQRKCPAWLIYAWSEEGKDVAWTKQDFTRKIKREYEKNRLDWWFTENYNNGRGVGSAWAAVRGRNAIEHIPFLLISRIAEINNFKDDSSQEKLDKTGIEQLAKLKSLSETYATTQTGMIPVKK